MWLFGVQCHLLVLVHCVFLKPMSLHPFTKKFRSTSCFLLLTSFLKMLISFSSRIWHLPTLPKAPKVGQRTMVLVCLTGQQTHQSHNRIEAVKQKKEPLPSIVYIYSKLTYFPEDLNYSLCALNLFNTRVSQFLLNYWNKLTFPRHSNLLRCTCMWNPLSCNL